MALDATRSIDAPPGGWPVPRSAYVHIPFCRHRCGYCNFSVIADRDDLASAFLTALDEELSRLDRPPVDTLFLGGGTPTHLDESNLQRLLELLQSRFDFAESCEWSVEANPEDISRDKLCLLADHGVNRISLGVQSFQSAKLKLLERGHDSARAKESVTQASEIIDNVSIDLIFAAPGESLEQWQSDVTIALSLPIQHLSTYALTFEKGTTFWSRQQRGQLSSLEESVEVEMYQATQAMTAESGLEQYEVSNFAKPGFQCCHNRAYWDGQGWYAAGPGAARFVGGAREVNHRSTTSYLKRMQSNQSPVAESEAISVIQYARERAAFGIRLMEGIDVDRLSGQTGIDITTILGGAIDRSVDEGLLQQSGETFKLTRLGILFADTVASRFLST